MALFSVIIPTYHRNEALGRCLNNLAPAKQKGMTILNGSSFNLEPDRTGSYEVIVTDDGSLDSAEVMLRDEYPWAKWIKGPKRGPAANRNYGAENVTGDWLIFVDDDCIPEANLLDAYARAVARENCSVLQGVTLPHGIRASADMECPVNTSGGHLWSCNFAIERRFFKDLGGFDENLTAPFMEDIDLQTRIIETGQTTMFIPEAIVYHPWRPRKSFHVLPSQARSIAYYVKKHPEKRIFFSRTSLLKRAVTTVIRDFPKNHFHYKGKGSWRMLILDLFLWSFLFKYLNFPAKLDSNSRTEKSRSEPKI